MNLRRAAAALGLTLAAGLSMSACTTHAGAAAQVGDTRIATSELRGLVTRGAEAARGAAPGQQVDEAVLARQQLTLLVTDELVGRLARSLGVSVTGQQVDGFRAAFAILQYGGEQGLRQAAARGGIAASDLPMVLRSRALEEAVGDKVAGDLTVPAGQVRQAYEQVRARFGPIPLTLEQATPELRRLLLREQRSERVQPLLQEQARKAGVSVNPRFGRWDPEQLAVVEADGSLSTPAPGPPATSPQPSIAP